MEIDLKPTLAPKPTLASLRPGDAFVLDEKGLHGTERRAYMVCQTALDEAHDVRRPVACLSTGERISMRGTISVLPAKAKVSLEVVLG